MRKRGLYGQTVTVYHPVPMKKRVDRYVLRDVFCQIGSREVPDAAGAKSGAAMLLVVPETDVTRYRVDYKLAAGDRVMLGEGPEVEWAAWPSFVPAEVDGLGAIRSYCRCICVGRCTMWKPGPGGVPVERAPGGWRGKQERMTR